MVNRAHAFARDELVRTLTSYTGITTADGAADGTTLIDSNLIGRNDFITEKTILIMSGPAKDEDKGALSFDNGTGTITLQGTGFGAQIKAGTIFKVLNISTVEIDVAAISAKIGSNTDPSGTTTLFARLRQIVDDYLANATNGLTAIKNAVDAVEGKLDDGTHGLAALKVLIDSVELKLDDGVHGLAALKTLIDAIEGKLDNPVFGLVQIKTEIEALETKLDDPIHGLANIKAEIEAIETKLDDPTSGLANIKTEITAIEAKLDDATYGLNALKTLLDAIEVKLDRLRGESPATGSVTGNWQSGTATSGETGADLVTVGANDTKYKLHSLIVSIHNLAAGAKATIKFFQQVNGTERKVYEQDFNKNSDPDACWVVNGTVGIHEALRVEVESNKAADNGAAIDYDYMLEAM